MNERKELSAYRTPNTKRFLKKDGTIDVEVYDENIHYLKDGQYEEIDNTLIETEEGHENKKNDFEVKFSEDMQNTINISQKNNKLCMSFKDAKPTISFKKKMSKSRNTKQNVNIKDDITYSNIYQDVDIKYEIRSNRLKESIILNKIPKQDSITFIIKTDLNLILNPDNTISIKTKRKERFKIEKPYMIDSNNIISQDVSYDLEKTEDGYELKITPNKEWLNDSKRVYPVIIDPTITGVKENKKVIDTYIYEGDDKTTVYNTDMLKIGSTTIDDIGVECYSLIKFDLPKIPTSYSVVDAKLYLVGYPDEFYVSEAINNPLISVHQITQDWKEETAKWKNMKDKFSPLIENYFYSTLSPEADKDGKIDAKTSKVNITNLVQKWYSKEPNYGLMLRRMEIKGTSVIDECAKYFSNDNSVIGDNPKPRLIITYRDFNGLEGYLSYTSQSHELGSSHINNFNGNLTTTFNVANTIGGPMPANMYLVYNTADVIKEDKIDYGYGLGIKPNLIQTIEKEVIEDTEFLKYLDEDGTNHYFYRKIIDGTKKPVIYSEEYYDEDGLGLKIEQKENEYIMTDKDSNTNRFIKHTFNNKNVYFLEEIKDTNNKTINIVYDKNSRIDKVIDASKNEITITYENNKISFISPHKTTIANYTNNKLISIEDLGDTETIKYNDNNLIEKIINSNGLSTKYEYINDLIYKVSKVSEYGISNEEGNYLEFTYNFKSTEIKDRKGHTNTYTFNEFGQTETSAIYDTTKELTNAYAKTMEFGNLGTKDSNRILLDSNYMRFVNNIITDPSLEYIDDISLEYEYTLSSSNIKLSTTNDSHYGAKALKATASQGEEYFEFEKEVKKETYYTFSTYLKNNVPTKITLCYNNTEESILIEKANEEFKRYDVSLYYPENATSNLVIKITLLEAGEVIVDDLQLEEGEIANYLNLINDGSYNGYGRSYDSFGISVLPDGTMSIVQADVERIKISENCGAIKIKNIPYRTVSINDSSTISGKEGDVFQYSFWYKNEGVRIDSEDEEWFKSNIPVEFKFYNGDNQVGETIKDNLAYWNTDWHYFSKKYIAPANFTRIAIVIPVGSNVNDVYFTNFCLFKDLENYSYVYDDEGNLVSSVDLSKETSKFAYNSNNQLIQATTPKGSNYKFEYDDNITDRLVRAISPTGITNAIDYDDNNNPIKTVVNNTQAFDDIIDTTYYIRARGTDAYMYINQDKTLNIKQCECSHDKFNIISEPNNKVKIEFTIIPNYYLKNNNGALKLEYGDNNNLFELVKHTNKSYSIKSSSSNLAITVNKNNSLSLTQYDENNANQQFLFERMESKLFIESSAKYTEDGRFIKYTKNEIGNVTAYDINSITGLCDSITHADGNIEKHIYDSKLRTQEITMNENSIKYDYDKANNLISIKHGEKEYSAEYNEFNNPICTKVNNRILTKLMYDKFNGNLLKTQFGNNYDIIYTYDEFDRVKTVSDANKTYRYYYDNLGRTKKIISNDTILKYDYDFAGRISELNSNDYLLSYEYDKNNMVTKKIEELGLNKYVYNYIYDFESNLTKLNILNDNFSYEYDNLGRLIENSINDNFKTTYSYITKGNKTSSLINKTNDNGTEYLYSYDKLGNILEIKKDNMVTHKYVYDNQSQLIEEINFINNIKNEYTYDLYGNIILRRKFEFDSNTLVNEYVYEYKSSSWQDLLTKFNGESITYDEIGNPISIGSKRLSWTNGRELVEYQNENTNIKYSYNRDGLRTSKIVNNQETKYYLEGSTIIFEKRTNDMLYYFYNGTEILGFVYNGNTYYYHKNIFGDIIGILDAKYNEIVTYEYDSWGFLLNINDNSNINLGVINPFRYRSYYYDEETKLYYLNTRYYNPEIGRFINADIYISTGQGFAGNNMYQYCANNPITNYDKYGTFILAAIAIGALASGTAKILTNKITGKEWNDGLVESLIIGGIAGGVGAGVYSAFSTFIGVGELVKADVILFSNLAAVAVSSNLSLSMGVSTPQEELLNLTISLPLTVFSVPLATEIDELSGIANKVADFGLQATNNFISSGYNYVTQNISQITSSNSNSIPKSSTYTKQIPKPVIQQNTYNSYKPVSYNKLFTKPTPNPTYLLQVLQNSNLSSSKKICPL